MPHDAELEKRRAIMNTAKSNLLILQEQMQQAGDKLQSKHKEVFPQIERLKNEHDELYCKMDDTYKQAAVAFNEGAHADAKELAALGREIQETLASFPPRWRALEQELELTRKVWMQLRYKVSEQRKQFRSARQAFEERQRQLKTRRNQQVIRAGVPKRYRDDAKVIEELSGNTSIYFGGEGRPDGPGHGHYVVDCTGKLVWRREPFEKYGRHCVS